MLERPVDLDGGSGGRNSSSNSPGGVGVVEKGSSLENTGGEAGGDDNEVVPRGLVGCDQDGARLPQVEVQRRVRVLQSVRAFHLHQQHLVPLYPKIYRCRHSHVGYPESVTVPYHKYMSRVLVKFHFSSSN